MTARPDLGAAADQMRTDRGLPSLSLDTYRPMAGAGARGMLGIAFGIGVDDPAYDAMREEFFVNYERLMTQLTAAFDGVPELIAQLEEKSLLWGVVTNKSSRFTDPLTGAMPLFSGARAIVSGDTTPHAKPHPAPLLEAAAAWASRLHNACMWAMMSATWWQDWLRACKPWLRPTDIWATRRIFGPGARMPRLFSAAALAIAAKHLK